MSDLSCLSAAGAVLLGAAFLQGVTGFGHALFAIGYLSLLLGPKEAVIVLTLVAPVIAIVPFLKVRASADWAEVRRLSLPLVLLGMPLGVWAFTAIDPEPLKRIVGAVLVLSAGYFLTPFAPKLERAHPATTASAGFAAGFLNGFASTGGPPLVLYLYARPIDKIVRLAVLQAVFLFSALAKIAQLALADVAGDGGMLTTGIVLDSAVLAVPVIAGVAIGHLLYRRIPAEPLRKASLALLVLTGLALLFDLRPGGTAEAAPAAPEGVRWAVAPAEGTGGRILFTADPLLAALARDPEHRPEPADFAVEGEDGRTANPALDNGWAWREIESAAPRTVLVAAAGAAMVVVNGERFPGDVYSDDRAAVPVPLRAGANRIFVRAVRGEFAFSIRDAEGPCSVAGRDFLLPDHHPGGPAESPGCVTVRNHLPETLADCALEIGDGDLVSRTTVRIGPLPPCGVMRAAFPVRFLRAPEAADLDAEGRIPLPVALHGRGHASRVVLPLEVRRAGEAYRETRISPVDGSVQYHAVLPPFGPPPEGGYGLLLSLHGASVEALGQARAYAAKPDLFVVAPTNRGRFGFDWQDFGRLDALYALDHVLARHPIDPERVYLTGHSMGGHGAWYVGTLHADRFAAVAPAAGWASFFTYGGGMPRDLGPAPALDAFEALLPGNDVEPILENLRDTPVFVLHGDADDVVPAAESHRLVERLAGFHPDFASVFVPGAGHWWGAESVDHPQLLAFCRRHVRPIHRPRIRFETPDPAIANRASWITVGAATTHGRPVRVEAEVDARAALVSIRTENAASLAVALAGLLPAGPVRLEVDGTALELPGGGTASLVRGDDGVWREGAAPPERRATFRAVFDRRVVFVYGTAGTPEENAAMLAAARYDAEVFRTRGNGGIPVLADAEFAAGEFPDRNVLLYGNAQTNAAWAALLPDPPIEVRRGRLRLGDRLFTGEFGALFSAPRPDGEGRVGAVAATSAAMTRALSASRIFVSGVVCPDYAIVGEDVLARGMPAVAASGFFAADGRLR